ncbi:unnamed protein product, partial [Brassica rapa]
TRPSFLCGRAQLHRSAPSSSSAHGLSISCGRAQNLRRGSSGIAIGSRRFSLLRESLTTSSNGDPLAVVLETSAFHHELRHGSSCSG